MYLQILGSFSLHKVEINFLPFSRAGLSDLLPVLEYGNANKKHLVKTCMCVSCIAMSDTL